MAGSVKETTTTFSSLRQARYARLAGRPGAPEAIEVGADLRGHYDKLKLDSGWRVMKLHSCWSERRPTNQSTNSSVTCLDPLYWCGGSVRTPEWVCASGHDAQTAGLWGSQSWREILQIQLAGLVWACRTPPPAWIASRGRGGCVLVGKGWLHHSDNPFQYGQCENYYRPALVLHVILLKWRSHMEITGDYWREHWKAWC